MIINTITNQQKKKVNYVPTVQQFIFFRKNCLQKITCEAVCTAIGRLEGGGTKPGETCRAPLLSLVKKMKRKTETEKFWGSLPSELLLF